MTSQDSFVQDMKNIRSERDFNSFIERHRDHPHVQKMLQMTQGRHPDEIMGVAQNLANASQVDLSEIRKQFGF